MCKKNVSDFSHGVVTPVFSGALAAVRQVRQEASVAQQPPFNTIISGLAKDMWFALKKQTADLKRKAPKRDEYPGTFTRRPDVHFC